MVHFHLPKGAMRSRQQLQQFPEGQPPQGLRAGWKLLRHSGSTMPSPCHTFSTAVHPSIAASRGGCGRSCRTSSTIPASLATSAAASTTTIERRAADVAILGSSCIAYAAAYSLARRRKKVVLITDVGLAAPRPPLEHFRPLHLTHADAALVSLSSEAAAYWRGLQAQTGASGMQLLSESTSLDVGPLRGGGGGGGGGGGEEAGELLGRLQDACKVAGVRLGSFRGDELSGLFPPLRLPREMSGLLQPEGGVLHSRAAASLLLSLGEQQDVMLRDRLVLRGWRDAGSHFVVRASGSLLPGAMSVYEVEQLLLAPDPWDWPGHVMRLFGAEAAGMRVVRSSFTRCSSAPELSGLPLWRSFGMTPPAAATSDGLAASSAAASARGGTPKSVLPYEELLPLVVGGYPARLAAPGSSSASVKLSLGLAVATGRPGGRSGEAAAVTDPWAGWQLGDPDRSGLLSAHRLAGQLLRGVGPPLLPSFPSISVTAAARSTAPGTDWDPRQPPQQQPWGAVSLHVATPDGWPVLGFLPGLEPGRLLLATTASCCCHIPSSASSGAGSSGPDFAAGPATAAASAAGSSRPMVASGSGGSTGRVVDQTGPAGGVGKAPSPPTHRSGWMLGGRPVLHDGYQLSPLLAKMAVDLMCGAARPQEADPERLDLARPALGARARVEGLDPWDGLARWQSGAAFREEEEAAGGADAAEVRERAEARARGARMLGRDAGLAEAEEAEARDGPRGI